MATQKSLLLFLLIPDTPSLRNWVSFLNSLKMVLPRAESTLATLMVSNAVIFSIPVGTSTPSSCRRLLNKDDVHDTKVCGVGCFFVGLIVPAVSGIGCSSILSWFGGTSTKVLQFL
jgi:hypothetical protein